MQQRRHFIRNAGMLAGGTLLGAGRGFAGEGQKRTYAIPGSTDSNGKKLTFGIISDLHHLQFGQDQDERARMQGFMDAVMLNVPDFIIQNGDFFRPQGADVIMSQWNRYQGPKYHVLGNHDMDKCDKATIMRLWELGSPYYSFDQEGYHFIVMDRNFIKQPDGRLIDYNNSNFWPVAAPGRSFTDDAQLKWLRSDLAAARNPSIVFMHQPVFLSDFFQEIGNAEEILEIFDEANFNAAKGGNGSRVAAVFMGHDHDDRYGERNGVHYILVNSATYVYTNDQAYFFRDPLYAFVTLDPKGEMVIGGRTSVYRSAAPEAVSARFPTRISDRTLTLT